MPDTGYQWVKTADGRERLVPVTDEAEREHYGTRYALESRKSRGAGYRLTVDARKKLFIQTGQHFDDHEQYKAWCRATGHRDIEKGEKKDEAWKILADWRASGSKGECPLLPTLASSRPEGPPLSEVMEKMRASGELQHRIRKLGLEGVERVRLPAPLQQYERG